jgi:2Fe-2S ferredoxin
MPTIHVADPQGRTRGIAAVPGKSLMETLRDRGGMNAAAICSGQCPCATCHAHVDPVSLDRLPRQAAEAFEPVAFSAHDRPDSRLSRQLPVTEALDGLTGTLAPGA